MPSRPATCHTSFCKLDDKTGFEAVGPPPPLLHITERPPETLQEALSHYELIYMPPRDSSPKTRLNYRTDMLDLIEF